MLCFYNFSNSANQENAHLARTCWFRQPYILHIYSLTTAEIMSFSNHLTELHALPPTMTAGSWAQNNLYVKISLVLVGLKKKKERKTTHAHTPGKRQHKITPPNVNHNGFKSEQLEYKRRDFDSVFAFCFFHLLQ